MGGTSFLRVPTLRAMGTRTGAVLNDSPVGCQSRDLAPPAGGVESPKTNISANSGKRYCLMGGTSFLRVPTLRAMGTRTGAVLNDSPVGCQSRDLAPPAGGVESPKTNISANSGNRYCLMGGTYFLHVPTRKTTGGLKR